MHVGNYVYIIVLKNAMLVNFWCGNLGARGPGGGGEGEHINLSGGGAALALLVPPPIIC